MPTRTRAVGDSLPFELLNKETTNQKLDYIPVRTAGRAGTTIQMLSIGNYAKSLLIIITPLQNFMKLVLIILGS
ncbi:MAG: hypothetical protein ABIO55_04035 [Ginsengibacter sp.]